MLLGVQRVPGPRVPEGRVHLRGLRGGQVAASQQDRLLRYRGGIFSSLLSVLYSSEIALLKMLILDSADAVESSKCS